jgi:hypothetical protein
MHNQFFIWPQAQAEPEPLAVQEHLDPLQPSTARYYCGILRHVSQMLGERGLTFLMTWHLDAFDERFRDAVVLLIGDEMYQTPSYATRVRAIFKTGGVRRNPYARTAALPWSIAWRVALRDARNDVRAVLRRRRREPGRAAPMFPIPLGYHRVIDVPHVPLAERPIDVFFAGALAPSMRVELRASIAARRQMFAAVQAAEAAMPDLRFEYDLRPGSGKFAPPEYSRTLMTSKIVLCPRGNFDETFRFFEAARCGALIVSEPLPERWYYAGAPVEQIRGWHVLRPTLERLADTKEQWPQRSEQTVRWWDAMASERAVARYVVEQLATLA